MKVTLIAMTKPLVPDIDASGLIAYCARVSNPSNQNNAGTAGKLLSYLARNAHWSPFEMAHVVMGIETTRSIAHQILRHRSFSFQEFSQRYAVAPPEPVFSQARLQDATNRQASHETEDAGLQDWWHREQKYLSNHYRSIYEQALKRGIAKEVARNVLPEGMTESRLYMAGSVRSWIHYCQLRCAPGTQKEHREVALACRQLLVLNFPSLEELFNEPN